MASKKYRIEDKINGSKMDLSLQGIVVVPIREMAIYRRVTSVDLSNNKICALPEDFPQAMSQLHNLDLSRNLITKLPETFGEMSHMRRLDLFRNKLMRLPMSISRMDKLCWLDMKENPLVAPLAKIVGECLTTEQCQHAAKNLVHFMRQVKHQCIVEKSNGKYLEPFEEPIDSSSEGKDYKTLIASYEIEETSVEDNPQEGNGASNNADYGESTIVPGKLKTVRKQKSETKRIFPRSRTGIHASAVSAPNFVHAECGPSFTSQLADFGIVAFNLAVRVFLYTVFLVLTVSTLTAMIVDYRLIQGSRPYGFVAYYMPKFAMKAIDCFQLEAQRYIAAIHYYFPYYPYIGFMQWIRQSFNSAWNAVKNIFA